MEGCVELLVERSEVILRGWPRVNWLRIVMMTHPGYKTPLRNKEILPGEKSLSRHCGIVGKKNNNNWATSSSIPSGGGLFIHLLCAGDPDTQITGDGKDLKRFRKQLILSPILLSSSHHSRCRIRQEPHRSIWSKEMLRRSQIGRSEQGSKGTYDC